MMLFSSRFSQAHGRLVQAGACFAAALLVGGCGAGYRPVISPINPSGPPPQPQSLVAVVSAPKPVTPGVPAAGVATIIDYAGDTIMAQTNIGPGPTSFSIDETGSNGYTVNTDGTLTNFPVATNLQQKQVEYTTLPTGTKVVNLFSPSAGLWASDLNGNVTDVLTGVPATFKLAIPVSPTPVMVVGPGLIGQRNYAVTQNFADPTVGCVAGLLVYEANSDSATARGGTEYWGYEIGLRRAESRLAGLVGVSGCLYAVRRSAYRPIAPTLISDFVVALQVRERGLKTVLEPAAVCYEKTLDRARGELSMRVRVAIRSIHALVVERRILNPLRYKMFAWQVWSHKVLRYASPFFILLCFFATLTLYRDAWYFAFAIAQCLFAVVGAMGFLLDSRSAGLGFIGKPYYFVLTNLASFIAVLRYARGDRVVTWTPVR